MDLAFVMMEPIPFTLFFRSNNNRSYFEVGFRSGMGGNINLEQQRQNYNTYSNEIARVVREATGYPASPNPRGLT